MVAGRGAIGHAGPQFGAELARWVGVKGRGSGRCARADGLDIDDAGPREVGEVVAPAVDLELEVAGLAPDTHRELGRHAPAELLERVVARVPGREHGRAEPLDVAVLVARRRTDVVGGDDPPLAVADAAEDEHDAERDRARRRRR